MCFLQSVHDEQWGVNGKRKKTVGHVYYGSCWWTVPPTMVRYTEENLKAWTDRELMKMHYYLTARLDGYGNLTADDSIKENCLVFRKVLAERGHDGIQNCMDNEEMYNWGYRSWQWTNRPIGMRRGRPRPTWS